MMSRKIIEEAYKSSNINSSIGGVTIDKDMYIVTADLPFHSFLWENTYFPITEIIHPDDNEDFKEMLSDVSESTPQEMFLLIKGNDDIYIPVFVTAKMSSGSEGYDLEFSNALLAAKSIKRYGFYIKKLTEIVSLSGNVIFEYEVSNNRFKIYCDSNVGRTTFYDGLFADFKKGVLEKNLVEEDSISDFNDFCDDLQYCKHYFEYRFNCSFIPGISSKECMIAKGTSVTDDFNSVFVVGIFSSRISDAYTGSFFTDKANLDPLTGLLNKRAIEEYAADLIKNGKRSHIAIAIMDIDYFKNINDTFGHMVGDEVLTIISDVLRDCVSEKGIPGRIGGDEFFIVFDGVESKSMLRIIIREIRQRIHQLCAEKNPALNVTSTLGVAQYPADGEDYKTLFKVADKALYIGKLKGRNRFIIYDKELHGSIDDDEKSMPVSVFSKSTLVKRKTPALAAAYISGREGISPEDVFVSCAENFSIDDLRIYVGSELSLKYSYVDGEKPMDKGVDIMLELEDGVYFNEEGVFVIDNVMMFQYKSKKLYDYLKKSGIFSAIVYKIVKDGESKGVIMYTIESVLRKWSEWDVNMISIVSDMLGTIALKVYS